MAPLRRYNSPQLSAAHETVFSLNICNTMGNLKYLCDTVCKNRIFEFAISLIIIINSVLIGVETYGTHAGISVVQTVILGIFTLEILIRYIAADSNKSFFSSGWNWFDLSLVLIGYIPESLFANASMVMAIRVLRVFRVLRLLRFCNEIKLIVTVFVKSLSALFYNVAFFSIFLYLFAIVGVALFKLPNPEELAPAERTKYELFVAEAPHAPTNSPEPFGTLHESMFTLFRVMTGDDWTDVRYNLLTASKYGLVKAVPTVITIYHVLWFTISAFLLLNLVVGAILNNYQMVMEAQKRKSEE